MAAARGTRRAEEAHGSTATELRRAALGFGRGCRLWLGLFVASVAITWAAIEPPPWLHKNAYLLALSGAFFAGMAQVTASVTATGGATAAAAAKLRQRACEAVRGGRLGLLVASTAITLAVGGEKQPGVGRITCLLALSGAFFAGVTQVAISVWAGDGRTREAANN